MSSVGLANRFAFLEEDGTSSGAVSAPQAKPAATAQKTQGTNQRTTGQQQQQQQQQQRAPQQQQQRLRPARPVQTGDFEPRPEGTEGSERGSRRGGFRGGRGGHREGGRPPKREFDRHSGSDKTGVKAIEKKGSRFNWGSDETKIRRGTSNTNNRRINEERADSDEDTASAVASETPAPLAEGAEGLNAEGSLTAGESSTDAAAAAAAAGATTSTASAAPKEEEGPKLLTLEEFKRLQEASAPKTELPKLRQAGENVDNSQWKNAVALTKNEDTEFFVPKKATTASASSSSSSSSASSSSSSSNKPKKVDVNITFFDPEQQRNERFDRVNKDNKEKESGASSSRGGNSGRGGRGGKPQTSSRGGYRSKPNFDVNDQKVFPTLGGK